MTSPVLYIDCETRSALKLAKSNVSDYARHWTTGLLGFAFAFDDEPVQVVEGNEIPPAVLIHLTQNRPVVAHNAAFERAIFEALRGLRISPYQTEDTMFMAAAAGLPRGLGECAKALRLEMRKDAPGHKAMMQFARPLKALPCCRRAGCVACKGLGTRYTWRTKESHPEAWAKLWAYCAQDVEVTRAIYQALPRLSESERRMAVLDAQINERGVRVDRAAATQVQKLIDLEMRRIDKASVALTGCRLVQTSKVTAWCQERDPRVISLAKGPVKDLLAFDDLDPEVRLYLDLRGQGAKSSTKKVKTLLDLVGDDSRLRWAYAFLGAISTGRWAGRGFQPQNLPRGTELKLKAHQVDDILTSLAYHGASPQMAEWLRAAYGPPLTVISECLRGLLIAVPGKTLVGADMNAIEARVLAWLAQELWILEAFEQGADLYVAQYALAFGVDPKKVDEYQRLLGKVMVLALGYQGAVGAWNSMAANYNVPEMNEFEVKRLVNGYRQANPNIVGFWGDCERAAIQATATPGKPVVVGPLGNVRYCHHEGHLWCELPSKRRICYPFARLTEKFTRWGSDIALEYEGPHKKTRQWTTRQAYGGLLVENLVQATASDLLRESLVRLEGNPETPVVMHTHDEVTVECSPGALTVAQLETILATPPVWAAGLPMKAKGWTCPRYQK